MTTDRPVFSVVMAVFNESACLASTLGRVHATMGGLGELYELVLVDDGSTDDTWRQLSAAALAAPRQHRVLRLTRNFGKEAAMCAGLEVAAGDAVIVMDADLQHPPEIIPRMVAAWRGGAELVEAVKVASPGVSWGNRIGSRLFYALLGSLSGYRLKGATDFKLLDRRVVEAWRRMPERSPFFRGMVAWLTPHRVQLEFSPPPRAGGASGWSLFKLTRLAIMAVTSFTSAPLHFITLAGGGFLVFAIGLGVQTLYRKLTGSAVSGFATVILLLLLIGSSLMIALGIIGEYVARIYDEVKGRPRFVIAEVLGGGESDRPGVGGDGSIPAA